MPVTALVFEALSLHPPMLTALAETLSSSINSSLPPFGPRNRNSLMTTCPTKQTSIGTGVGNGVAVNVGVAVGVEVEVDVDVGVSPGVGVWVGVGVAQFKLVMELAAFCGPLDKGFKPKSAALSFVSCAPPCNRS